MENQKLQDLEKIFKAGGDAKPVLANSYFCGVDFGNGTSQAAFTVFKNGNFVLHTRKMWKAKLYIWWKRIWHNVTVLQEQK